MIGEDVKGENQQIPTAGIFVSNICLYTIEILKSVAVLVVGGSSTGGDGVGDMNSTGGCG